MTAPYPPSGPRRLTRSSKNKVFGGVCSGLADYLNMDANLVRLLAVLITLFTGGIPIVVYLVALFLVPEDKTVGPPPSVNGPSSPAGPYGTESGYTPYPTAAPGPAPAPTPDPVWGSGGAPWEQASASAAGPAIPPSSSGPATSAPEGAPTGPAEPEPVAETPTPDAPQGEQSDWESTPAQPPETSAEPTGETPTPTSDDSTSTDQTADDSTSDDQAAGTEGSDPNRPS